MPPATDRDLTRAIDREPREHHDRADALGTQPTAPADEVDDFRDVVEEPDAATPDGAGDELDEDLERAA